MLIANLKEDCGSDDQLGRKLVACSLLHNRLGMPLELACCAL